MKKFFAAFLSLTIISALMVNAISVFASDANLMGYFNEGIISVGTKTLTSKPGGSNDLTIKVNGNTDGSITVTGLGADKVDWELYNADVIDADTLVGTGYNAVGRGAYGDKIIKYTQNAGYGMLRLKNYISKTNFVAGDRVRLAMRVYLTDIHDSFGVVDSDKSVSSLEARVFFNVNGSDNANVVNARQKISTNSWQVISSEISLDASKAAALNAGKLGMRFDFYSVSADKNNVKELPFAATVFYDDYFVIEKTGTDTGSFADWSLTPDATNGMAKLTNGNVSNNGVITFTTAGAYANIDGFATQKASANVVTVGEIKSDYAHVATGLSDSKHLVKLTQNGNMSMLRMVNAVPKNSFKEGELVDVTMRMYLTDIKKGAQKASAELEADTTTTSLTGRFALRSGDSDVQHDDISIPVNQWVTVTKRFRIAKDSNAVHGFRFDFKGGTSANNKYYDIPFAATVFYDGTYEIAKVTDEYNTSNHLYTVNAENTSAQVTFNAINPENESKSVVVAGYGADGRLVDAKVVTIAANSNGTSYGETLVFEVGALADVALLYWDGFANMTPLQVKSTVYKSN